MSNWRDALQSPLAVLLGGTSAEREVSLDSGREVLAACGRLGVETVALDPADANWSAELGTRLKHAFIALHGPGGEDGTVQGLLQVAGVSYTGSGVLASALAMDKTRSKQLWRGVDLPTPDFVVLQSASDGEAALAEWGAAIVKPTHEGSSIGMAKVHDSAELHAAFAAAQRFDRAVLMERWVQGAEYTVAILGARALPAIRLQTDREFYDYEAKYLASDTRYLCPCGLSEAEEAELQQLALRAFASLDCCGWGRVDFMRDGDGRFLLLEVNTVPGMTDHSLVPMAGQAAGIGFDDLVERILALSLEGAQ